MMKVENESLGVYTLIDTHNVWCALSRFKRVLALEENAKPPVKLSAAADNTRTDSSVSSTI